MGDDLVDPDVPNALRIKKLVGGPENPLPRAFGCDRHVYPLSCSQYTERSVWKQVGRKDWRTEGGKGRRPGDDAAGIPAVRHSVIPSFRHSVCPSFRLSVFPSFHRSVVPSFPVTFPK